MGELPSGTVTFLLCEIVDPVELALNAGVEPDSGAEMAVARDRFDADTRAILAGHDGRPFGTWRDSVAAAFSTPSGALAAAIDLQKAAQRRAAAGEPAARVRIGLHACEAEPVAGDYLGAGVQLLIALTRAAHPGQIVTTGSVAALLGTPEETSIEPLGRFHLLGPRDEPRDVHQITHPDLPASFPPLRVRSAVPGNLPTPLTSFVGRAAELQLVAGMLDAARIVTIVGPAGSGKTRLAIEAAHAARARCPDGTWFVELASMPADADVGRAIEDALGWQARASGSGPEHPALVLIDNCEHVLAAVADAVADLAARAPALRFLLTSHAPLSLPGEQVIPLRPLTTHPESEEPSEAAQLFVARARNRDATFSPSDDDLAAIGDICRRLDGLPLAIELAAAHVGALSVREIAARSSDRFTLLSTGSSSVAERQRTLRAAIDWGFDLLDQHQRTLLGRVSVFSGGFTLEAAEEICADETLPRAAIFPVLAALVERSFVMRSLRDGQTRYHLLETIRHYAAEQLTTITPAPPVDDRMIMRRDADVWTIEHGADTTMLKDSKGLRYLAALLDAPGRELFVLDLIELTDAGGAAGVQTRRALGDAGPVTDARALEAYRARIVALEADLDEAQLWNDQARAAMLQAEIDTLTAELAKAVGLHGAIRTSSSAIERARTSVTKAIRSTIKKIRERSPALADHLAATIRTGVRCAYDPTASADVLVEVRGP